MSLARVGCIRPAFSALGSKINEVEQFTYLGRILTSSCDLSYEIQHQIKQASSSFARLMHRVFLNHNLALSTKIRMYKAICLSTLLYSFVSLIMNCSSKPTSPLWYISFTSYNCAGSVMSSSSDQLPQQLLYGELLQEAAPKNVLQH